jgi:hypothetical protein
MIYTTWGVKVVFIVLKELTGYVDLSFSRINLIALGIIVLKNGPKCRLNPKTRIGGLNTLLSRRGCPSN